MDAFPVDFEKIERDFTNPLTGEFELPKIRFIPSQSAWGTELDIINNNPNYQQNVLLTLDTLFREKWLYHNNKFRKLLKYFKTYMDDDQIYVTLVDNHAMVGNGNINPEIISYVLKYIDMHIAKQSFIQSTIKNYLSFHKYSYYNILNNTRDLRSYICDMIEYQLTNLIGK